MEKENKSKLISLKEKVQKKIGIVRTYSEDMANVIETNEDGIIKKIIKEQEEHEAIKKNLSPESAKNKLFMLVGFILIVSALALLAFLILFRNKISTVEVKNQFVPIIFTDNTEYKEVAGFAKNKITQTILDEIKNTKIKPGKIESIYLTENKKIIGLRRFIALIKSSFVPGDAVFIDDNFLIGITDLETDSFSTSEDTTLADKSAGKNLVFILRGRSFLDIFSPMKNWESSMFSDMHGFFGIDINADNNYLLTKDFDDGIVNNKNARILHDKDNNLVFEYVFTDQNSVILGNNDQSIQEAMSRLISMQIKK